MKKRILALCLSVALLFTTALVSALAAPKAPKIKSITVGKNYKSATVKWSKVKSAKKYQIKYGYKKSLKGAKTKTVAKIKVTLKKLKAGKTLYVKVRAKYKSGKKFKYTKYSAVKSVKLAKAVVPTTIAPTTIAPTTIPTTTAVNTTVTTTTEAPTTIPTTTVPPLTEPVYYNMTDLSPCARPLGRGESVNDTLVCDYTASGYECGVYMQGDLTVNFSSGGHLYLSLIGVVIDDDYDNMYIIEPESNQDTDETLDTNLPYGHHKIRVMKLTLRRQIVFTGLTFSGTLGEKPAEKELKIEVYGDSITCGCYNTPGDFFNAYDGGDGSKTYATFLARDLDADLNVVAWPGWGLSYSYRGFTTEALPTIWDKSLPKMNGNKVWDFTRYEADIVIINLGQNDSSAIRDYQDVEAVANTTEDSVKQAALTFITNIRQKYPNCKIVWVEGMMDPYNETFAKGVKAALGELDETYYCVLPSGKSGGAGHPNVEQHKIAGTELLNFLKDEGIVE